MGELLNDHEQNTNNASNVIDECHYRQGGYFPLRIFPAVFIPKFGF